MAVTCGFYNALNHDRLYDAIQMSSIFDGIIRDGVFSTIGDSLIVTSPEDGMFVDVGPGRAWFNHTWTLNDTEYPVEAEEAEVVLDRIDAVVLEVNANPEVRNNRIYFVKGTPSSNPVRPTMIHNAEVNQYALAYVRIRAGQTTIFQQDITNVIGTDETPFVTGLLQQVSIEHLILQWEADFNNHFDTWCNINEAEFEQWSSQMQAEYNTWLLGRVEAFQQWYADMQAEGAADLDEFDAWFQHMKDQLDTDAAGHLQAEIDALSESAEKGSVVTVHTVNSTLHGRTCTITQDGQSRTATFDNTGTAVFESIPYIGQMTVSATDGSQTATGSLSIPYFGRYSTDIAFWAATINITTSSAEFFSLPIKVFKNDVLLETIAFSALGTATYTATGTGLYKFVVTYDDMDIDASVNVTSQTTYNVVIDNWTATINMTTSVAELYGRGITISKGGVTVGTTTFNGTGHATYKVHETGTYRLTTSTAGGDTFTADVVVTAETAYEVSLGTPQGSTATPTDVIQTWLKCAVILDKNYTTLSQVLNDRATFERLLGDSNACDYMARSTTWASTIAGNATAMATVGKYDYCCSKLLSNATWASAIGNSTYKELILNVSVPTMTSNTAPSGVVSASSVYQSGSDFPAWKAFNPSQSYGYVPGASDSTPWIQYDFGSPVQVNQVYTKGLSGSASTVTYTAKVQGSNDGSVFEDIADIQIVFDGYGTSPRYFNLTNDTAYRYLRVRYLNSTTGVYTVGHGCKLQFYGRKPSSTPKTLIHSAANDTIYYLNGSTHVNIATTGTDGTGVCNWANLTPGTYRLYSTVAKQPDNLSAAYYQDVVVTDNTAEVYLMPYRALYWYGWKGSDLQSTTAANGWQFTTYTMQEPTWNTHDVTVKAANNIMKGIGVASAKSWSKFNAILRLTSTYNSQDTNVIGGYTSKTVLGSEAANIRARSSINNTTDAYITSDTAQTNRYLALFCAGPGTSGLVISAVWLD